MKAQALQFSTFSDNARGAILMMGAMCAYTVNDVFMKIVTAEVPLFQAIMLRGLGAIVCLIIMCRVMGQWRFDLPGRDWAFIVLRTLAEVGGTYFFLTALMFMPIANISAILQALPLTVALAAALFLGDPLGWRRLTAIVIGFAGVMLIIQPGGEDFSSYSVYALIAVACVTLRDITVRRISKQAPPVMIALSAAVGVTLLGAVGALAGGIAPMGGMAVLQLACATVALIFGYVFSVTAMQAGEISFVAPFRYTSLIVALVLGVLVFGEWPNGLALLGAGVVVATGLFTLYRERQLRIKRRMIPDRIR